MKESVVKTQAIAGRLRLRWSYGGRRFTLSLGMDDSAINRAAGNLIAKRIEADIASQNFDESLKKYQPQRQQVSSKLSAIALYEKYFESKRKGLKRATVQKYQAIANQIRDYFGEAFEATEREAIGFVAWMQARLAAATVRDRLSVLKAGWEWAKDQGLVEVNPWINAGKSLKKTPKKKPQPFTVEEVRLILERFNADSRLSWYRDFVEFKLRTGARTGEVVGLCWRDLSPNCHAIAITQSVSKGVRSGTKTGEDREFLLSPTVQALLLNRRPDGFKPDDLVFPGQRGKVIDAKNFAARIWKPTLEALNIPYRKPYNTRSTFVSHALEQGATPGQVGEITGHSQDVLFRNYAGAIQRGQLPELW